MEKYLINDCHSYSEAESLQVKDVIILFLFQIHLWSCLFLRKLAKNKLDSFTWYAICSEGFFKIKIADTSTASTFRKLSC